MSGLRLTSILGEGAFGKVFLGVWRGLTVGVKVRARGRHAAGVEGGSALGVCVWGGSFGSPIVCFWQFILCGVLLSCPAFSLCLVASKARNQFTDARGRYFKPAIKSLTYAVVRACGPHPDCVRRRHGGAGHHEECARNRHSVGHLAPFNHPGGWVGGWSSRVASETATPSFSRACLLACLSALACLPCPSACSLLHYLPAC